MPREFRTLNALSNPVKPEVDEVMLTSSEASRLLGICIEMIDLCAKVTGKIDPAVGTVVGYAREEALAGILDVRS
jgi:hypothetical protein